MSKTNQKKYEIVYCCIARGTTILVDSSLIEGNLNEITFKILKKIDNIDSKISYSYQKYLFHCMTVHGIIYLCVSREDFGRRIPFLFLDQVQKKFFLQYGDEAQTAEEFEYQEFEEYLEKEMIEFSTNPEIDKLTKVKSQVNDLKDVLVTDIEKLLSRGEKINDLVVKSENLSMNGYAYKRKAVQVKRRMWFQKLRYQILLIFVLLLVIFFILVGVCGISFRKCRKKEED
ncbi:vesicle-associated membrane protein [Anaeramoeba flamelloides]|uniref:Vesicle-associated membrane protein n=1 Tax=Anaeramoeba flamelloides TaxID=1746091 RepID=A0AAV7YQI2_9EUKA|nr:vesicle-associated membrane protein [Anaeramoeba flamelloides]KAJ6249033.1 vesicle-associated membrane protein [Anaeramoeba flamelloides]